ncbi:MAG: carbohydrate-binding protein [Bacteroidales bacterium]|nr:carbohydrate-binding protein [Bacteroidales bacterium]
MSESGENSNTWFTDAVKLFESNNIGWSWWPVKKSGVNNILKVTTNPDYKQLIDAWNGNGTISADEAYNAVMKFADNHRFENCSIAYDVIDALIRQPSTAATKPFTKHTANQKIFASDYDLGQNGYAYSDKVVANYNVSTNNFTAWNTGWEYRNDGVDIQTCEDAESNGYCVGWTEADEWLQYTIELDVDAEYTIELRTASASTDGVVTIAIDGIDVLSSVSLPKTTGWQSFKTNTLGKVALTAGEHRIKIKVETGDFNISYLELRNDASQSISLEKGWNLVSFYLTPNAAQVSSVFPNASLVKSADSFYKTGQTSFLNSLTEIKVGEGYLVYNTVDETLTIQGTTTSSAPNNLKTGWNLIGIPIKANYPITSLPNETQIVKDFDSFYEPASSMNIISELEIGKAYYIKVSDDCEIDWLSR